MLVVTPAYAALMGLVFMLLSVRTLLLRRKLKIGIGDGKNLEMLRAMRVHANFAEYVPITLILVVILEINQASPLLLHALCTCLLAGRLLHAFGVRRVNENYKYRVCGMALTFTSLGFAILANLFISATSIFV